MDDFTPLFQERGAGQGAPLAARSPQQLLGDFSVRVLRLLEQPSPSRAILLDALTACFGGLDQSPFDERIRRDPHSVHLLEAAQCLGYLIRAGRLAEDGPTTITPPESLPSAGGSSAPSVTVAVTGDVTEPGTTEPGGTEASAPSLTGGDGAAQPLPTEKSPSVEIEDQAGTDDDRPSSPGGAGSEAGAANGDEQDRSADSAAQPTGKALSTGTETSVQTARGEAEESKPSPPDGARLPTDPEVNEPAKRRREKESQDSTGQPQNASVNGPTEKRRTTTTRQTRTRPTVPDPLRDAVKEQYQALLDDAAARIWLDSPVRMLKIPLAEQPKVSQPVTAGDYWRLSYAALLRLPDEQRVHWHERLSGAAQAVLGLRSASERSTPPLHEDLGDPDVLIPALPGHCGPVLLSLRPASSRILPAGMPPEIMHAAGLKGGPAAWSGSQEAVECRQQWAVRAYQVLQLAKLDPLLMLRWMGRNAAVHTGMEDYFPQLLVERLKLLTASQKSPDPENRFRSEHRLDALIGSVLHATPASEESWWWRWRAAAWTELAKSAAKAGYTLSQHPENLQRDQLIKLTSEGDENNVTGRDGAPRPLQWVLYALARAQDGTGIGAVIIRLQQ
ncbi:hypothetical protein [Streptomyces albipurpureus]|uniref:Uncharacterized protein n=1 Tax=Streptomyces albipurpureus TaxID=2897419 RepID=A0ABT0UZ77_9ACTN|nr:hypothetical protein [Streptomyces sp. CWNU-1]MCM2393867.1 hypothetical protein [Streptomyces sp. CWNU-1]